MTHLYDEDNNLWKNWLIFMEQNLSSQSKTIIQGVLKVYVAFQVLLYHALQIVA